MSSFDMRVIGAAGLFRVLVIGDSRGHILFFDKRVRILYWIRSLGIGAITELSFPISPKVYQYENSKILIPGW